MGKVSAVVGEAAAATMLAPSPRRVRRRRRPAEVTQSKGLRSPVDAFSGALDALAAGGRGAGFVTSAGGRAVGGGGADASVDGGAGSGSRCAASAPSPLAGSAYT